MSLFHFTAAESLSIQAAFEAALPAYLADKNQPGIFTEIYDLVGDILASDPARLDDEDRAVFTWVLGARNVNANIGFQAAFIREFTAIQFEMRNGDAPPDAQGLIQRASNGVAFNFFEDLYKRLTNTGLEDTLPTLRETGENDAGAAASEVFEGAFAPWAGTLLFSFLGFDGFYREWLLTNETVEDRKFQTGTYDLLAAVKAGMDATVAAAGSSPGNFREAIYNSLYDGVMGEPPGALDGEQDDLVAETNQFFRNSYGLDAETIFRPGDNLVFRNAAAFLGQVLYVLGTLGDDDGESQTENGQVREELDTHGGGGIVDGRHQIVNAGEGDDVILGSGGRDLIDGGVGRDTLEYGESRLMGLTVDIQAVEGTLYQTQVKVFLDALIDIHESLVYGVETIKLTDGNDRANLDDADPDMELTIDMGAGDNWVEFTHSEEEAPEDNGAVLRINFSTTKADGSESGEVTNTIVMAADADANARIAPILTVDGKQLVGGAAFDFNEFDLVGGRPSVFSGTMDLPGMPWVVGGGGFGVSTTDRVDEWLGEHIAKFTLYLGGLIGQAAAGTPIFGGIGSLFSMVLMPLLYGDLLRIKDSWSDFYTQRILGTHGELYELADASYDSDGRVTAADLTVTMNLGREDAYEIQINDWKQGDFGIRIENLAWHKGLESGTNKNGILDDWRDLSLDTIRDALAGLGFEAKEISDGSSGQQRQAAASNNTTSGLVREGNEAANTLAGTTGDDVFNGARGNDTLGGGDGRDAYNFRSGDGHDVIIDQSGEGNIIRFLEGLDTALVTSQVVAGSGGAQDLLISYGDGDTIRIVAWSNLSAAQQELWEFVSVAPAISSQHSADTPDISVLPETQGGTAPIVINGTSSADNLQGTDLGEAINGQAGNDTIAGDGGDDTIGGGSGDDLVDGNAGDDTVTGGDGRDHVNGGAGDDRIYGDDHEDIMRGGTGNDRVEGGYGADTYIFARGDGQDVLYETDGQLAFMGGEEVDVLKLDGINSDEVRLVRTSTHSIALEVIGTDDRITLLNQYGTTGILNGALDGIDRIVFGDGVTWTRADIDRAYREDMATAGNDAIYGFDGAENFSGGAGDDHIVGGAGSDSYFWRRGDGNDIIVDDEYGGAQNRLVLGPDVAPSDITLSYHWPDSLRIDIAGAQGGSIIVRDQFVHTSYGTTGGGSITFANGIRNIVFDDGTIWSRAHFHTLYMASQATLGDDTALGSSFAEVFESSAGNDWLEGRGGNDTYRFGAAFGQDTISDNNYSGADTIEFTAHALSDLTLRHIDGNLFIDVDGTTDQLTIDGFYQEGEADTYMFADGTTADGAMLARIADHAEETSNTVAGTAAGETLDGTVGYDKIKAGAGNDIVNAGGGNDMVGGGSGDDQLHGEAGHDVLIGDAGADTLTGGSGNDLLIGGGGNDTLAGGDDADELHGDTGDDQLAGNAGADMLRGGAGNDILTGGTGADVLRGGSGNDSYVFNRGDGADILYAGSERGATDVETLVLGGSITLAELQFDFSGRDLIITFANTAGDRVTIADFLGAGTLTQYSVAGVSHSFAEFLELATGATTSDATTVPLAVGSETNVVYGGRGNDQLYGDLDRDIFVFSRGDGIDRINDWAGVGLAMWAKHDELLLVGGIRPEDLVLSRTGPGGEDLTITFTTGADRIDITRQFDGVDYTAGVDAIRFEDGTSWDKATIINKLLAQQATAGADSISGLGGDETLQGGAGDDLLQGGGGEDRYLFGLGHGADTIIDTGGSSDTLAFATGILPGMVTVTRNGQDAILQLASGEQAILKDMFVSSTSGVDRVTFADGTIWSRAAIAQMANSNAATSGNDTLTGSAEIDVLAGGAGDDVLEGAGGGDTYVFNAGDGQDIIRDTGSSGIDTLALGNMIVASGTSVARSGSNLLISTGGGDSLVVEGHFDNSTSGLERILFASGEVWSRAEIGQKILATAATGGADTIVGTAIGDTIEAGAGADSIDGGAGADTYVFAAGDGSDTINDTGAERGVDRIVFDADVSASDIDLSRDAVATSDLIIFNRQTGQMIRVVDHFEAGGDKLASISFASGVAWDSAQIRARADNAPPTIAVAVADQAGLQDTPFFFAIPAGVFADSDVEDTLAVTAQLADGNPLPAWLSFDGLVFSGLPGNADVGSLAIRLIGTDSAGNQTYDDFVLAIGNVNDAPVLSTPIANQQLNIGAAFSLQLAHDIFTDSDNGIAGGTPQAIGLSATLANGAALPSWLSFNAATRTFSGTPGAGDAGQVQIAVTAADGTASTTTYFGLAIGGGNTAPLVGVAMASQIATQGADFAFTIPANAFSDANAGDRLRYTATLENGQPLPAWLSLNPVSGALSGRPVNGDVGQLTLSIRAADITGATSGIATLVIDVGNVNDAPTAGAPLEGWIAGEDVAFSYSVPVDAFADVDAGDSLTLSATLLDGSPLPAWLSFDPQTGTLSGTPGDGDVGFVAVSLVATDLAGASASQTFYLIINGQNDAPVVVTQMAPMHADRYAEFSYVVPGDAFADVDSGALVLTATLADDSPLPDWMTFDGRTATFSGDPDTDSVGTTEGERTYVIKLIATDAGGASVSQLVTLVVHGPYPGTTITGTAGDDTLLGTYGPDTLIGGLGNDTLQGTLGVDIYHFERGDGQDLITNGFTNTNNGTTWTSGDVVRFGSGITVNDIVASRGGSIYYYDDDPTIIDGYYRFDLVLTVAGSNNLITIDSQFNTSGGEYSIKEFHFADGSVYSAEYFADKFMHGGAGNDLLEGDIRDNLLTGGGGNDRLIGGGGNDTLDGGAGNDDYYGELGDDVYLFNVGSGQDRVIASGQHDVIRFGTGITVADLVLTLDPRSPDGWGAPSDAASLLIEIAGTTDSIRIYHYGEGQIGSFEFGDGTVLTHQQLDALINPDGIVEGTPGVDYLNGSAQNDRMIGGAGDDRLLGQAGNDTYVWNLGDGSDSIDELNESGYDILEFGADVQVSDVVLSRTPLYHTGLDYDDLYLDIISTGERVSIEFQFTDKPDGTGPDNGWYDLARHIDEVRFADGTVWTFDWMMQYFLVGTPGDDTLLGYRHGADVLDGGAGNDILKGESGSDTYVFAYGYGVDTVYDKNPSGWGQTPTALDYVRFQHGVDEEDVNFYSRRALNAEGVLENFLTLGLAGSSDEIRLHGYADFLYGLYFRETGNTWTKSTIISKYVTQNQTAGDDLFVSFFDGRTINTGAGNDTIIAAGGERLIGGTGNDTYEVGQVSGNKGTGIVIADGGTAGDHDVLVVATGGVSVSRAVNGHDVYVWRGGWGPGVVLEDFLSGTAGSVEEIRFSDGAIWDRSTIIANLEGPRNELTVVQGTAAAETLTSSYGTDDILDGKGGNDTLQGSSAGGNVFLWRQGDGNDVIDNDLGYGSADILKFVDVQSSQATLLISGSDLKVRINTTGEVITVLAHFASNGETGLDEILFADGVFWRRADVLANSVYEGTVGADALSGTTGANTLVGLDGDDRYIVNHADDVVVEAPGGGTDVVESSVTYELTANVENLTLTGSGVINGTGTAVTNTLIGNSKNNILTALGGNDTLNGGGGVDTLIGGTGDDTYVVDTTSDIIVENEGEGIDAVNSSVAFALGSHVEKLLLTGTGAIAGTGNAAANMLTGNSGSNVLAGLAGADTLDGAGGTDTASYVLSDAAVTVRLMTGIAQGGHAEGDTLLNIEGVTGSDFDDTIEGNALANTLTGGAGIDTLSYANAGAGVTVNLGTTTAQNTGGAGSDTISGFERLVGSGFADSLTGSSANNTIWGGAGNDTLNGGAGADTLHGEAGDDIYVVDNAGDMVIEAAGAGTDLVQTTLSHVLADNVENLTLAGTGAIDGTGNELANTLLGTSGNNILEGRGGADTLNGGNGTDTASYASSGAGVAVDLLAGTAASGDAAGDVLASIENLLGSAFADTLTGNAAANVLTGAGGNDSLNGGAGADTMVGGQGDDTYFVDATTDVVTELAGEGTDTINAAVTYTTGANVENLTLTGSGAINATGNTGNNLITGNTGNNVLAGLAGADTLDGGLGTDTANYAASAAGVTVRLATGVADGGDATGDVLISIENLVGSNFADTIEGDAGINNLAGGGGVDTLSYSNAAAGVTVNLATTTAQATGGGGSDTISGFENIEGSGFADTLTGTTGANTLSGLAGADTLNAGNGDDVLNGGSGADAMTGGSGNDTYFVDDAGDGVTEAASGGTDTVRSSIGYALGSNVEHLVLLGSGAINGTGNTLANSLTGNSGANTLSGGSGNDTLSGEAGNDLLIGGIGDDGYGYVRGHGNDTIQEGTGEGTTDQLTLSGVSSASDVAFTRDGFDVILTIAESAPGAGDGGTIVFKDQMRAGDYGVELVSAGAGVSWTKQQIITLADAAQNTAPTIQSNGGGATASIGLAENLAAVAMVWATDPDSGAIAYSITGGADAARFTINAANGQLDFIAAPNFEAPQDSDGNNVYEVIVQASDGSLNDSQTISVTVTNVNEAPVIGSNGGGSTASVSISEGSTAVATVNANDVDASTTITYSIVGGADASRFGINAATGALVFIAAPDFDVPTDSDADNDYEVIVQASDGQLADSQAISVVVTSLDQTITGTTAGETLAGGLGDDTLSGLGGADTMAGGGGSDTYVYNRGDGEDVIVEGDSAGNDVLRINGVNAFTQTVISASGTDLLVQVDASGPSASDEGSILVKDFLNMAGDYGVETIIDGDSNTFTKEDVFLFLYGNSEGGLSIWRGSEDDTLIGTTQTDSFHGGGGNDSLFGAAGADDLIGEAGDDLIEGGAGSDWLVGGTGADSYVYARGDGNDTIVEGSADGDADVLQLSGVNAYTQTIISASGTDLLIEVDASAPNAGDEGSILIKDFINMAGDYGVEIIIDGDGNTFTKEDVFLFLYGNEVGGLSMVGTSGNDVLIGTAQEDAFSGDAGDDVIEGGGDDDWLDGGSGADTFVFRSGFGQDGIGDFEVGVDTLEFHDQGSLDFASLMADADEWGGNAWLNFDGGELIILHGVALSELSASDFRFM